jgi:hypothetical protein
MEVDVWARKELHFSKTQVHKSTSPPRSRTLPEIEPFVLLPGARERERYHSCILSTYVKVKTLEFDLPSFFTLPSLLMYILES